MDRNVLFKSSFDKSVSPGLSLEYLRQKCEKISNVLYILSSKISDNEPLKVRLREKALSLMLSVGGDVLRTMPTHMGIGSDGESEKRQFARQFSAVSTDLSALVRIGVSGGFISKMNAAVLVDELQALTFFVSGADEADLVGGDIVLRKEYFEVGEYTATENKGHKREMTPRIASHDRSRGTSETGAELRRRLIVSIIQEHGRVSIKDISSRIKDVSEKTVQRELVSLVASGTIARIGSRRWSMYEIAKGSGPEPSPEVAPASDTAVSN